MSAGISVLHRIVNEQCGGRLKITFETPEGVVIECSNAAIAAMKPTDQNGFGITSRYYDVCIPRMEMMLVMDCDKCKVTIPKQEGGAS